MTAQYKVTKFEPSIDGQLAVEWSRERNAVVYKTGLFRLAASVEVSIDDDKQYEIGFIQVSRSNFQSNFYTSGATQRWELDGSEVDSNGYSVTPVNDSDSDDHIPWYHINPARTIVSGLHTKQVVHVDMNDNFSPTVSWTEAGAPTSYLYRIFRNQVFDVWLVAHRSGSSEYTALRHVAWQLPVVVEFTFDSDGTTSKPNHSSWLDKSGTSLTWSENPNNLPSIPSEAFRRPRVNAALGLYRYPADGSQKQFVAWAEGRPPS